MKRHLLLIAILSCLAVGAVDAWRPMLFEAKSWSVVSPDITGRTEVFSPLGFELSLAILGEGTGGEHRANISEALGLLSDFDMAFTTVVNAYNELNLSNRVFAAIAPSLWTRKAKVLDVDYVKTLQRNFGTEIGVLTSPDIINLYTEMKTDGRIRKIVSEEDVKSSEIVLTTGVAFEGAWLHGFNPLNTKKIDFTREDKTVVKVDSMTDVMPAKQVETDDYVALKLDYAESNVCFLAILPKKNMSMNDFRKVCLNDGAAAELKIYFRSYTSSIARDVNAKVTLPKFEVSSVWRLDSAMCEFNVPQQGYARIGPEFKIDNVRQMARINIGEKGGSLVIGESTESDVRRNENLPDYEIRFDRPFIWMIWETNTDTVLLMGAFNG